MVFYPRSVSKKTDRRQGKDRNTLFIRLLLTTFDGVPGKTGSCRSARWLSVCGERVKRCSDRKSLQCSSHRGLATPLDVAT